MKIARACSVACLPALLLATSQIASAQESLFQIGPVNSPLNELTPGNSSRPNHPVERFPISLSKAFETSYTQNPSVVAALKNIDVAKAQITTAGARPNPQLAIQYGVGTPYTEIISGNTQQIGANQLVEMGGKRGARLGYARANYILSQYQLADLRYDVRSSVRKGYAELAAAEANIDLVENQRALLQRLLRIAKKRVEEKKAEGVEVLQSSLAVDQFETTRNSALARLRQASIQLDYLLGFDTDRDLDVEDNGLFKLSLAHTELVPDPAVPIPPLNQLLLQAENERPDLQSARQQVVTNRTSVHLEKTKAVPDVLLGSGWAFSTYKKSTGARQQEGAYFNVNVDIPIFYRHQGEIAAAKHTLQQSQLQATAMVSRVSADVRVAYSAITSARANLGEYQRHLIPLALNMMRQAEQAYESGSSDLSNAAVAQQQFQQTFSNYFDTVVAYQTAWADLETAVGKKLEF